MKSMCEKLDAYLEHQGGRSDREAARWLTHLSACPDCREQAAAHAALRKAFDAPPDVDLGHGFGMRLRRQLELRPAPPIRKKGLAPWGRRLLAGYGITASAASALILSRIPWPGDLPIELGVILVTAALLSPAFLFDRTGIVLPPGGV